MGVSAKDTVSSAWAVVDRPSTAQTGGASGLKHVPESGKGCWKDPRHGRVEGGGNFCILGSCLVRLQLSGSLKSGMIPLSTRAVLQGTWK